MSQTPQFQPQPLDPAAPARLPRSIRLLVVEDDPDQRQLLRETLDDHFGVGSVVCVDGQTAALQQDVTAFDLILADYNLPDATGMELLQALRMRCATPVIMVTGENVGRTAASAIRHGATDYVVKTGDYLYTIPLVVEKNLTVAKVKRENETLRAELERALAEVRDKNAQLEISLRKVEELAATDPLTGLYNRRHFGRVIEQLFAEAQRYDSDLACAMIDLDNYKALNDRHGHAVGDQMLMIAGRVISNGLRKMDLAARYGGDEFVLLFPRAHQEEARMVVQRIGDEFRCGSRKLLQGAEEVTMSFGVASLRALRPTGPDQLVKQADLALYRAKAAGRAAVAT